MSLVQLCVTPWTVACQAPLSMGFPRQEYWSGLPFPSPGVFFFPRLNSYLLHWKVDFFFFTTELYQGNPCTYIGYFNFFLFCLKGSFLQPFTPGLLEKKRVKQRSMNSKADSISQANSFMPIYSLCKISEAQLKNDAFLQ